MNNNFLKTINNTISNLSIIPSKGAGAHLLQLLKSNERINSVNQPGGYAIATPSVQEVAETSLLEKNQAKLLGWTPPYVFFGAIVVISSLTLLGISLREKSWASSEMIESTHMDIPYPYQLSFQDPATPAAIAIQDLHHNIMIYLSSILVFVVYLLLVTLFLFRRGKNRYSDPYFLENFYFEIFITLYSGLFILAIIMPSTVVMYTIDYFYTVHLTVHIIGAQWFWRYIYGDYVKVNSEDNEGQSLQTVSFQSNIIPMEDLQEGDILNLSVDNPLVLPCNVPVNLLITSQDVMHSFAIPSAGLKMDAIPGRVNSVVTIFNRPGTFTGQCSELCGVGHARMPIVVHAVDMDDFFDYIVKNLSDS